MDLDFFTRGNLILKSLSGLFLFPKTWVAIFRLPSESPKVNTDIFCGV